MQYPRVTSILGPFADFSMVPPDVLQAACERGDTVHAACAAYALDLPYSVPEELAGYFKSFASWFDRYVVEVLAVEQEVVNRKWGYVGHVDLIARVSGFNKDTLIAVIDHKTPITANRSWKAQVAAYVEASRDYGVEIGGDLQLRKDGKLPKMEWVDDISQAFNAFCGILSGWNYLKGGKG
jgi:hypothetical protein